VTNTLLSDADVSDFVDGRHRDPLRLLGMHADESGALWVRAFLPDAVTVDLLDAVTNRRLCGLETRHSAGFFEARVPRRKQRFAYRYRVTWRSGNEGIYADAYAFLSSIGEQDLYFLGEGTHLRPHSVLGAHVMRVAFGNGLLEGVRFAVWAPNAGRVSVVGSFNNWDGRRHPLRCLGTSGVWELFVPHAGAGDTYKFEIVTRDGALLPLKADPYARRAELRPQTASIVENALPLNPLPDPRREANARSAPMSIYEVHLPSWRKLATGDATFPTWDQLAEALPAYASEMGFTHIELLPISEHPFDGSWGYQTLGMFATSARFGSPEGLVRFVKACHARGLGVLLDWVPAHFPSDAHGLAQFDGTAEYEYADPREGFHRDWNTLIYNFGRNEVRNFLTGSALYWIEQFGVDGLRVDAVASMLYRDYSRDAGEWIPNAQGGRENLEAISLLKRVNEVIGGACPGAMTVAEESTAFPGVSSPTYAGGLGFHFKWNMGWMNDTLRYIQEDPVHRRWHHDKMTFGLVYAFSENFVLPISHDEVVHGKGSMLAKMPGDEWQKFANLRAYYGFMWGHPGKKLLFMGQEFAQPHEWNHDAPLPWHLLDDPKHRGMQSWVRDLNQCYRELSALHAWDCDSRGFEWLVPDDRENSVLAWMRRDEAGNEVIVVSNLTPVPREGYRIPMNSKKGAWRERLNSDAKIYGGSGLGNAGGTLHVEAIAAHDKSHSLALTIPPLATLFLVRAA
jgi:1,4-alpha-glucan branching enzyme